MTERLFHSDAYCRQFDAEVTDCVPVGAHFAATLTASAFYPTAGGQPNDVGLLGGRRVLDVVDDDGRLLHIVDGPLEVGESVHGAIDWVRRFDHMQQHSGQHLLSAAFETVCKARTESFHLGAASATIDLHRPVSPEEIAAAEDDANHVVWQDRELRVRFVSAEEAAALPLRKASTRTGRLRLIEVADYDLSACGGSHVARTGGVGLISVIGWEKFKGGTRLTFRCGGRALAQLREWRDVFQATNRALAVAPVDLAPAIERLQGDNKTMGRTVRTLQDQLALHVAAELVAAGIAIHGRVVVVRALEGWDAEGIRSIAAAVAARPGALAALFTTTAPALAVVARSADVDDVDASVLLKALIARFGGKGGGRPDFAQGGGLAADSATLVAAVWDALSA